MRANLDESSNVIPFNRSAGATSEDVDGLLTDYLAFNGHALDTLVELYDVIEDGADISDRVRAFSRELGNWERKLAQLIGQIDAKSETAVA